MPDYQRVNTSIKFSECIFYSMLVGDCNCNLKYRWKNLTTNVTKTGAGWKAYFATNVPDCGSSGGSLAYVVSTVPTTKTTVTNAALTGSVVAILTDGGGVALSGFSQVGTTVTLTDGSGWVLTQKLVILQV